MPTNPVIIDDAETLREESFGYRVRVQGRDLFIGRMQLPPGRLPPPVGLRGPIVLFREAAWDLGLVPRPQPELPGTPDAPVTLPDVRVTADAGAVLVCVSEGRRFLLLPDVALPGTTVRKPGDRGAVVIPRWLARDLGLLPDSKTPPSGVS
jgi:hypothetical protein